MLIRALTVAGLVLVAACGQDATPESSSATAAPATPAPATPAALQRRPSPAGAMAYFIEPADGATVTSPVRVVFGLKGAGIAPAGVEREGTGHHHLLIDTDLPDLNQPIPSDANHRHFGGGQTEVELEFSPGTHTLQLLLGDERHLPHDPPILSDRITIQVR